MTERYGSVVPPIQILGGKSIIGMGTKSVMLQPDFPLNLSGASMRRLSETIVYDMR